MLRCAKIFSVLVSYARAKNADLRLPMSFCPVYGFIPVKKTWWFISRILRRVVLSRDTAFGSRLERVPYGFKNNVCAYVYAVYVSSAPHAFRPASPPLCPRRPRRFPSADLTAASAPVASAA